MVANANRDDQFSDDHDANNQHGSSSRQGYIFRRTTANIWEFAIAGSGIQRIGSNLKGFEYLAKLVSRPNALISALELSPRGDAARRVQTCRTALPEYVFDAETAEAIRQRIAELRIIVRESDDPQPEKELRELKAFVSRSIGLRGTPRKTNSSDIDKARQSVANAIRRALAMLAANGITELVHHLHDCGRSSNGCFCYRVESPPNWDVSWLEPR